MNKDFLDLISALLDAEARFLVVGGYAVAVHGHPRATKDIDIFVEPSVENAARVFSALRHFGAPLFGLTKEDLATPGKGLMMGAPPRRIDILTRISGVDFMEAWKTRDVREIDGCAVPFIGRDALLKNKRLAGRAQDLADIEQLETSDPD